MKRTRLRLAPPSLVKILLRARCPALAGTRHSTTSLRAPAEARVRRGRLGSRQAWRADRIATRRGCRGGFTATPTSRPGHDLQDVVIAMVVKA